MTKFLRLNTLESYTDSETDKSKKIKEIYKRESSDSQLEAKIINLINGKIRVFNQDSFSESEMPPIIKPLANESNTNYHLILQEKSKKQAAKFLGMLRNEIVEPGFISATELYLKSELRKNPFETKDWLNRILIDNLKKPDILVKLLHIISDIDYNLIEPQGPTFALAASRHPDNEVQEYSIRVFEKWGNRESLEILKGVRFQEEWLQEYADEVINDLEEELCQ